MNYGDLKAAVISDSHRPDLADDVPRFIREAEGMIRRDLRAFPVSATLGESDRVSGGVYTLPTGLLELRTIYPPDSPADALEQVSLSVIRRQHSKMAPRQYAVRGSTIEIRGVPAEDTEFGIEYLGHPPPLEADEDTNVLLTDHESLYLEGALFFLFKHVQDVDLAQGALDTFANVLDKLNEQFGRRIGGASVAAAYNFGGGSGY